MPSKFLQGPVRMATEIQESGIHGPPTFPPVIQTLVTAIDSGVRDKRQSHKSQGCAWKMFSP